MGYARAKNLTCLELGGIPNSSSAKSNWWRSLLVIAASRSGTRHLTPRRSWPTRRLSQHRWAQLSLPRRFHIPDARATRPFMPRNLAWVAPRQGRAASAPSKAL